MPIGRIGPKLAHTLTARKLRKELLAAKTQTDTMNANRLPRSTPPSSDVRAICSTRSAHLPQA